MNRFALASLFAIFGIVAGAAAEEKLPSDQPPEFFIVTAIEPEHLVIKRHPPPSKLIDVPLIVYQPTWKTLQATDARGRKLTVEEVRRRLKPGSIVLVNPEDETPKSVFLSVIKDETVVLSDVFPRKGATGITAGGELK